MYDSGLAEASEELPVSVEHRNAPDQVGSGHVGMALCHVHVAIPRANIPLVICRSRCDGRCPGLRGSNMRSENRSITQHQAELAKTFESAGKQVVAEGSRHEIQLDAPDLVVQAIRDVWVAAGQP